MRKLLFTVAIATATIATAVPAAAQHRGDHDRGDRGRAEWNRGGPTRPQINNLLQDLRQAENRIARAQQRRIISPREAVSLRREANQIRMQLNRAARNGINNREFGQLRVRVNRLEQRVRIERRDRDRRPG